MPFCLPSIYIATVNPCFPFIVTVVPLTDNTKYQAQEYYEYNDMSFYEIEAAIQGRVQQPSKYGKLAPK